MNKPRRNRVSIYYILIVFLVCVLMVIWLAKIADNSVLASKQKTVSTISENVAKSIRLCYSIEGMYPPSIEYLEKNYGLVIDDNYFVHYERVADNLMPEYEVLEKKVLNEDDE